MRVLPLLALLIGTILLSESVRSQPAGCSAYSTDLFNHYDEDGRLVWATPAMECVEFFDVTVDTPHGTRHIRAIGDVNADTLMPRGGIAQIEAGVRAAAARFGDLGDYKISDVVILITGVDAETAIHDEVTGTWKHATPLADARPEGPLLAGICPIRMFTVNDMTSEEMKQAIAHELFHCVQFGSLTPAQMKFRAAWWVEGSAMMFVNHVFPNLSPLMRRERVFHRSVKAGTPIYRWAYEAMYVFLWYDEHTGISGLLPLLRSMPASQSDDAQIGALSRMLAPEQWLQFAKDADDSKIRYRNGEMVNFGEPVENQNWAIDRTTTVNRTLRPFVLDYGWTDYQCGLWGNALRPADVNLAVRNAEDNRWNNWPDETDCRERGSVRYRTAALHTGRTDLANSLRADRRIACAGCDIGESHIDQCVVGVWQQSGGGVTEWLRANGFAFPFSRDQEERIRMTMNDDGTFTSDGFNLDYQLTIPTTDGTARSDTRGTVAGTSGRWSAGAGEFKACFDHGGEANGVIETRYSEGGGFTAPHSTAGLAGHSGSSSYTCSSTTLTTAHPTPGGTPMTYIFTRVPVSTPATRPR